jgi:hypothetical protein
MYKLAISLCVTIFMIQSSSFNIRDVNSRFYSYSGQPCCECDYFTKKQSELLIMNSGRYVISNSPSRPAFLINIPVNPL